MNFKDFYTKTEQRLQDSVLSLWATGDKTMQDYFKFLLEEEKIMAKPVFQNTFPWDPSSSSFANLTYIFKDDFIDKLDKIKNEEYRFPKDRFPYKHQIESWNEFLNQKKSILVTTGTGSGKTECFMLPVLQDIFENSPNSEGINAIFLYPLNALIASQRKRIHEWCKALGNINYAVYNGSTKESVQINNQKAAYPEIISRKDIRKSPPQILFTNPTMLEYLLVRDKDIELLQKSQGKLKWILLDEAHTLTGSKAAEMALLIRRIVDAFNVDVKNVRFAVTSATVGDKNDDKLIKFMAGLCGIEEASITIIKGNRKLPTVDYDTLPLEEVEKKTVKKLQQELFNSPSLDTDDIGKISGKETLWEQLELIDKFSESNYNGDSILPVRGHFFTRNINGVYCCTNPECTIHGINRPAKAIGTMHTIANKNCECGFPLLELVACRSCGNYLLEGEKENRVIKQTTRGNTDLFEIEPSDDFEEDETQNNHHRSEKIVLVKRGNNSFVEDVNLIPWDIDIDGNLIANENGKYCEVFLREGNFCPHCGESNEHPFHFRLSTPFTNRIMSDVVLEQTQDNNNVNERMLWNGKKYISFTDSRQGTAKISALINIDSESYWLRSLVYHKLCEKRIPSQSEQIGEAERIEIFSEIKKKETELITTTVPILRNRKLQEIEELKNLIISAPPSVEQSRMSWNDLYESLINIEDFKTLFYNILGGNFANIGKSYLRALFFTEFSRRIPRERSLENLGMVNIAYPSINNLSYPFVAQNLNISHNEWKDLVKIALDYVLRSKFHIVVPPEVDKYSPAVFRSYKIYPSDTKLVNVKRWPSFNKNHLRQNRLSLLICASLGLHSREEIDREKEDEINSLLDELWIAIRTNFLTLDGDGYKLNLEDKSVFELSDKVWLCPVKRRLIDKTFKGYSPWITGNLTSDNIRSFKVGDVIEFPMMPFPFNIDETNKRNEENTINWIKENSISLKNKGLWNSIHERIIIYKPLYLAGEHSAQQSQSRLEELENKFQNGEINILSCSTTMEMGVDIGGISAVVMSNVPPSPANYLQRTGRAGRRRESKSIALTFCASNPIGANVMTNPKWALEHKISSPMLAFNSVTVVERHLNAFFLGKFVNTVSGLNIKEKIQDFFFEGKNPINISNEFLTWLNTINIEAYAFSIKKIVKDTQLESNTPTTILNKIITNFNSLKEKTVSKKINYDNVLSKFSNDFGETSPAFKAISFQKNHFLNKNNLTYLSEEGFLPSAGIPTGIVEFDTINRTDLERPNNSKQLPSFHITRALSEYAPGNSVVINGWNYKSAGIVLKNSWGNQSDKNIIQFCRHCGYQFVFEKNDDNNINNQCPSCKNDSLAGLFSKTKFTELIEPAGFAVDIYEEPTRKIAESSHANYVEPLLIGVKPWSDASHPIFEFRDSEENAEILYFNMGNGSGYAACLECGRVELDPDKLTNHRRLRGGRNQENNNTCGGNENPFAIRQNVILGGRFQTDFFELRIKELNGLFCNDQETLFSLGVAVCKSLTSFLAIEESEVNFGIKKYESFSTIFIFDTAKGGAGYASQCSFYIEEILKEALNKLESCSCLKACTKCLIDRNSQFNLDKLNRHKAIQWLKRAVDNKIPEYIRELLQSPKKIMGGIKDDLAKLVTQKQIKAIWLYVSKDFENWDTENIQLLNSLRLQKVAINLIFSSKPKSILSNDDKVSLIQISSWSTLFYCNESETTKLKQVCRVQTKSNSLMDYYTSDYQNCLNANWGVCNNDFIYRTDATDELKISEYKIDLSGSNIFEVFIESSNYIKSDALFNLFLNKLQLEEKKSLLEVMEGKDFKVSYSDRYLKTPLACLLLTQFIRSMKTELNFSIREVLINVKEIQSFNLYNTNMYIINDCATDKEREVLLKTFALDLNNFSVNTPHDLPHYRYFKFYSDDVEVIIRPDAGIEHGWFVRNKNETVESIHANSKIDIVQRMNKKLLYTLSINNQIGNY